MEMKNTLSRSWNQILLSQIFHVCKLESQSFQPQNHKKNSSRMSNSKSGFEANKLDKHNGQQL